MEDNEDIVTEVTLGRQDTVKPESTDPFQSSYQDVRTFRGLSKSFVRKADRKAKNKAGTKQLEPEMVYGYTYFDCVMPPENMEYLAKLYDISSAHRAAVDAKVASVFGLGYQWIESSKFKRVKNNTRTESGVKSSENTLNNAIAQLEDFIEDCNDRDVFEEVLKKVGTDYEVTGNAYIEIGRDINGKIGYIGHIPAQYMRVRRDRDGYIQLFSNLVRYFRNFGDVKYPNPITNDSNPNEIIHLKKYTPTNTYYGMPDILSAKNALAGNEFASRYNLDFFENKAIPRYAIVAKKTALSPKSVERLIEFFESGLRGQPHRTIFIPLLDAEGAEIKFEAIETGNQDSSFGEFRYANNEDIFMAHRTPQTRAGIFGKNVSLAAARDADKIFKESYSRPEQAIFEKKFNKIIKEMTPWAQLKLNELSLTDEDTQSKIDEREVRMGIQVPDEVRAKKGTAPRPDGEGNKPWQANSQQAADQKSKATASRTRDRQRSSENSDGANATGRNSKGEGRRTA